MSGRSFHSLTASVDVGPTLRRRGLLDLEAATQKLEGRVVERFNKLLQEFELLLNSQNFLAIATQRNVVTGYCGEATGMEPVSGWRDAVRLYERDISESDRTFAKPATLISAFVKIILTDARSDPAEIISTRDKMQAAIDAQYQLLVTKFSEATRGFVQKLLQCHEEAQANVRKFHDHFLVIEVYRYLSDAMQQGLRRHLPNQTLDFASELRKMQVLDGNYEKNFAERLDVEEGSRSEVVSGFGHVLEEGLRRFDLILGFLGTAAVPVLFLEKSCDERHGHGKFGHSHQDLCLCDGQYRYGGSWCQHPIRSYGACGHDAPVTKPIKKQNKTKQMRD